MGRPTLGGAAKSVVVSTRMTPAQAAALAARYGTPARGVAALVNAQTAHRHRRGDDGTCTDCGENLE